MNGLFNIYIIMSMTYKNVCLSVISIYLMKVYCNISPLYIPVGYFHFYHTITLAYITPVKYNSLYPDVSLRSNGWL